jgi:hypothetical protein
VLAHQPFQLLVVHGPALLAEGRLHSPPTVGFKLVLDGVHRLNEGGVVACSYGSIVVGGARDPHQTASFRDGEAAGPAMTDMGALLGRAPSR